MAKYGYARVSSSDQNPERQIIALKEQAVDRIFTDKESGKDFDRPQYQKMLRLLKKDDCVFFASLDRLGRNYELIREEWAKIVKKGVDIVVLDMPLLDTRQGKNIIGTFISDLVLQILAFVAHIERENIRKRQAEGIAAAKARGVRFGHAPRPLPENFMEIGLLVSQKLMTVTEGARRCGMARSTFERRYRLETEARKDAEQRLQMRDG